MGRFQMVPKIIMFNPLCYASKFCPTVINIVYRITAFNK